MARSDQTAFTVEVLEGPATGATIPLVGREMPYRAGNGGSIGFGRTQRTKLTWYPGSRTASQQIIGPVLAPTTINGIWKERYLGEDRPIDLVELFEELLDTGVQVRVSWQTRSYEGIVKTVNWNPGSPVGGLGDIAWEIVFEWNRAGTPPSVPVVGRATLDRRDRLVVSATLVATVGGLVDALITTSRTFVGLARVSFQATRQTLRSLLDDDLGPVLESQSEAAARSADFDVLPPGIAQSASSSAGRAQEALGEVAEVTAGIYPGDVTEEDSLEAILVEYNARSEIVDAAVAAMESQFDLQLSLEGQVRPDVFETVPALAGSDLRELAIRFYGDADLWPRIARQNGLADSLVPVGLDVLVVPLSLPDSTDDRVGC